MKKYGQKIKIKVPAGPLLLFVFFLLPLSTSFADKQIIQCVYPTRNVQPCKQGCERAAIEAFEEYANSQRACGVRRAALPFILKHKPESKPAKGTIVLVHGLSASPGHLRDVAARLQREGYNVVVPILSGHGGGDALFARSSLSEWKKDVEFAGQIAEQLGGPLFIGGHSTGGTMAAVEATDKPGRYSAFLGFDPALAATPAGLRKLSAACVANEFWDYPSQLPGKAFGGNCPREIEVELIHLIANMDAERLVAEVCGDEKDLEIPPFNAEFSLAGGCALAGALKELKGRERMKNLPPPFVAMSNEQGGVFETISRDGIRNKVGLVADNSFLQTKAPSHSGMLASCSPGYDISMKYAIKWLESHRGE